MGERELQRRRRERRAMGLACRLDPPHPLHHLGRRVGVIVFGARESVRSR